ncbi:translation initiation factor IF-2-like [Zalophus californianus]|uniref:Translation initiation factor IF-2-like n=1 Tax=Zalophus californianus TaxID=9704 RepID=A0A6J2CZ55_ZALCA|nr:translation initiation factor IF-2-like [Zalophus californianus]XP_027447383.2 translation initiation factor IF-2-like [Zalophus californianus]
MPMACGGTTRKLGRLPLLLLLAPSARVRSSPRTYAAAAPAGDAVAGGGPRGQPGAVGGAAGGAAAARGVRSPSPACGGCSASPSPSPAEARAEGCARRPGAWGPRVCAPARFCTPPPPHPLAPWTSDPGVESRRWGCGVPGDRTWSAAAGRPSRATKGQRGVVGSKLRGFNPVLRCPQGQAQCTRFAPWRAGRD